MKQPKDSSALYFAYGANLNLASMRERCPNAVALRSHILKGWRLVFRGVADIVPDLKSSVPGALYRLTPSDVESLDRYEGVHRGVYAAHEIRTHGGDLVRVYRMEDTSYEKVPELDYLNIIREGYLDWRLPLDVLEIASGWHVGALSPVY